MKTISQKEKRRARDAKRRAAELDAKHQHEISLAKGAAFAEGQLKGMTIGANQVRAQVLEHAGRLYKERKDTDAAAVREVHRQLASV